MNTTYKYYIKVPDAKGKLRKTVFWFTTKDLERLLDYYGIPYEKVK